MNVPAYPLSIRMPHEAERLRLLALIDPLVAFLSSPGDWGYDTQLGDLTRRAISVRDQLRQLQEELPTVAAATATPST